MGQANIYRKKVLTAQSAGATVGAFPRDTVPSAREHAAYVVFSAGCSAGQVKVESAHDPDYTGTWAEVGSVDWVAASRAHVVNFTGAHAALRLRISTAIVGGTVDGYANGN